MLERRKRWLGIIVLALVAAFAVAACGGDDSGDAAPAEPPAAEPEAPAEPPAEPPAEEPPAEEPPAEEPPAEEPPAEEPPAEEPPAEPVGCEGIGIDDGSIDVFAAADIDTAVIGQNISPAAHGRMSQLWIDKTNNEDGGILGCEVNFTVEDDAFDIETCVRLYRDAIASGQYDFFIGPSNSGCMASLPALTDAAGKWIFTGVAADHQPYFDNVENGQFSRLTNQYIAHPSVSTFLEGRTNAIRFAELGCQRVATIVPNYAYGQDVGNGFKDYYPQLVPDGEIVNEQFPEFDEDQFTPFFNAMLAENPDCIMSAFFSAGIAPFMIQWGQTGEADNISVIGGLGSLDTFSAISANDDIPPNFYAYARGDSGLLVNNPVAAEFIDRWTEAYGDEFPIPDQFTFQLLSTWQMAKTLIEETGSIDPEGWRDLIETGTFGFDGPYNPGLTYVNPINHMADTCASTGLLQTDTSTPPYNASYDPDTFLLGCMRDVLQFDEAKALTDNDRVDDATLQAHYDLANAG